MDDNTNLPDREYDEQEKDGTVSFPVDISREEYIRFNVILSKNTGFLRFRRGQLALLVVVGAVTLLMFVSEIIAYRGFDPILFLMLVFLAVIGVMMFFGAAKHVRNGAARSYDQTRMNGHSYYGIISVYPDRIEKKSRRGDVSVRFQDVLLYMESKDIIVLVASGMPSIVIPARCLTGQLNEEMRKLILSAIPVSRQRIRERIVPTAAEPIQPEWSGEGIRIEVDYTREEVMKMAADRAGRNYVKMLPYCSILSLFTALLFSYMYNFGTGILTYLGINGGLFAFQFLVMRSRAGRLYDNRENSSGFVLLFKQAGIEIRTRSNPSGVKFLWSSIDRAVERKDSVEIFIQSSFLRIPKRCIPDFGELKAFVDSHFESKRSKK